MPGQTRATNSDQLLQFASHPTPVPMCMPGLQRQADGVKNQPPDP